MSGHTKEGPGNGRLEWLYVKALGAGCQWSGSALLRQPFTLTSSEQNYYVGRNLSLPKCCVACRQARRRGEIPLRAAAPKAVIPWRQVKRVVTEMDEPPVPMHQIICSECGQETLIPAR